jgi:hypothetical protein
MFKRTLVLTTIVLLVAGVAAADDTQIKIIKAQKTGRAAAGTGLQGTIAVGQLPAQLQQLTCKDLSVHVGILHAGAAALTSFASAQATGDIASGQCAYTVSGLPAGGPFEVVVVGGAAQGACRLSGSPSFGQVTFTRGTMAAFDVQLAPVCDAK